MSQKHSAGSVRRLVLCALLVAMSIVFGRILAIDAGALRFNLGAVPVLLAAIVFGPLEGAVIGGVADMLGAILVGYAINPIITLGASSIGLVCGLLWRLPVHKLLPRTIAAVFGGHIVGSLIINSLALRYFYGYAWAVLALRIPSYLLLSCIETAILYALVRSGALSRALPHIRQQENRA